MVTRTSCTALIAAILATLHGALGPSQGTHAQTGIAGTWQIQPQGGGPPWTVVLREEGAHLIGAVSSCSSGFGAFEISDGRVDGDVVSFKCTAPNAARTVTFRGRYSGEEITFTWDRYVAPGRPSFAANPMFGDAAPREFTVRRVAERDDPVTRAANVARRPPAVSFERLLRAEREPENWLTFSGNLRGWNHSPLTQVDQSNVSRLGIAWWHQARPLGLTATPLVVNDVLYTVEVPNTVVALNAATGAEIWRREYTPDPQARASGGGGRPNRGLAIAGGTLYMGTIDAHLLAIDAFTGRILWNTTVADAADPSCRDIICYSITHAPLIVKDKVLVGVGGGDGPTRCFIAAFDTQTGKEVWRFYTVPGPGEAGNETWAGDSWKTGGAGVWNIGSYDVDLNLTYWGTGNPYPVYDPTTRLGDNLYSNSVVALDADTGRLKWHYQFTPHDTMDWDANQIPVLVDAEWQGQPRKLMVWANRNGLMYVLDRASGEFLMGEPFAEVNWMNGFDPGGRPRRVPPTPGIDAQILPDPGATWWMPPSFSPRTQLFYIPVWEGRGGKSYSAIRAFRLTGTRAWQFPITDGVFSAVLTTASDLLFSGTGAGYLYALDARTGKQLWSTPVGNGIGSPITYSSKGKQYLAVIAGDTLFAFAIRQP